MKTVYQLVLSQWAVALSTTSGFLIQPHTPPPKNHRAASNVVALFAATPGSIEELFESEGWLKIKEGLNDLPVFCCVNEIGEPVSYTLQLNGIPTPVAFFYTDVDAAKEELAKARKETNDLNLDLVPYPLGDVFQMAGEGKAVVIPGQKAIVLAGAPEGTDPLGQQVPLFCCMEIMQEDENGAAMLPMFMVKAEAQEAMEEAVKLDGGQMGDVESFEVVSMSLNQAVQLLATVPDTPAFQFIPPASSVEHIRGYDLVN
jgi:hypothetical protein